MSAQLFKATVTATILLGSVVLLQGEDFKTTDGKEYTNVKLLRVEPDGPVVLTKTGAVKLDFTKLPKDVQEKYHFDPAEGAAFAAQTAKTRKEIYDAFQAQRAAVKARQQAALAAKATPAVSPQTTWTIKGEVLSVTNDGVFVRCSHSETAGQKPQNDEVVFLRGRFDFVAGAKVDLAATESGTSNYASEGATKTVRAFAVQR